MGYNSHDIWRSLHWLINSEGGCGYNDHIRTGVTNYIKLPSPQYSHRAQVISQTFPLRSVTITCLLTPFLSYHDNSHPAKWPAATLHNAICLESPAHQFQNTFSTARFPRLNVELLLILTYKTTKWGAVQRSTTRLTLKQIISLSIKEDIHQGRILRAYCESSLFNQFSFHKTLQTHHFYSQFQCAWTINK